MQIIICKGMNLLFWACRYIFLLGLIASPYPAIAQAQELADIEADQLIVDDNQNIVRAQGNVHVRYLGYALRADMIEWTRDTDRLVARGRVVLDDGKGSRLNAPRMLLTDHMRNGIIEKLIFELPENASLRATRATRKDGVTTLDSSSYTACKICDGKKPFWRIRAQKITHDESRKTVVYRHARLEFGGIPVFYMPWFLHYTPDVKKHSGILVPSITSRSTFGIGVSMPIFWNIAPNYDITFTPTFTSKQGIIFDIDWRHKTKNGQYDLSFIGTRPSGSLSREDGIHDTRLGILGNGRFFVNGWDIGFQLREPGDDLFFYRYDIDKTTILESHINGAHDYTSRDGNGRIVLEALRYRYVLGDEDGATVDNIFPNITHTHRFDNPILGGRLILENRFSYAHRKRGLDITRAQARLDWRRKFSTSGALVFDLQNRTQIDLYFFNSNPSDEDYKALQATNPHPFNRNSEFLVASSLSLIASIPLHRTRKNIHEQIIPQIQIVLASKNDDYDTILYRTTAQFDLAPNSIFSLTNPEDEASRLNLGIIHRAQFADGLTTDFFIGQSFNLTGRQFGLETGLTDGGSNIITQLKINRHDLFFEQNLRINNHNGKILRNETNLGFTRNKIEFTIGYFTATAGQLKNTPNYTEEIRASFEFSLGDQWTINTRFRRDLQRHAGTKNYIDISYEDDCTDIKLSFEHDNTRVRTVEAETTVRLQIILRSLGGIGL